MSHISRVIPIEYDGGAKIRSPEEEVTNFLKHLTTCTLKHHEDLRLPLLRISELLERFQQLRIQLQNDESSDILDNLSDIRPYIDLTKRFASLSWSIGHTLSSHYYQRNHIPIRFDYEKINKVGVWHDEFLAKATIAATISKNKHTICTQMKRKERKLEINDVLRGKIIGAVSIFHRISGKYVIYTCEVDKNGKETYMQGQYVDGNFKFEDAEEPMTFCVCVILGYRSTVNKLSLLTAYPLLPI
jgi:hypothetical protein